MKQKPFPTFNPIITKEVMTYKQQIKKEELTTKIRIVRAVRKDRVPIVQVAKAYGCHRNTIRHILYLFETQVSRINQDELIAGIRSYTQAEISEKYKGVLNSSRRPKSNKRTASKEQEAYIVGLFQEPKLKVGVARMSTLVKRKHPEKESIYHSLTPSKMRGIYKRNNLTLRHVRSSNGERRHLYDYTAISCFSMMHYDVKHILDKHALPDSIYQLLSGREIPKYEWNIIDARSRFRFIAYSYNLSAEFGQRFLMFVIQYIRATLVAHYEVIKMGIDNGSEFCSGSQKKEDEWNDLLSTIQTHIYSYNPNFDIRKNLIERSHLTDDEELYIPRGEYMGTKETFIQEASNYSYYWNHTRSHSGIGMNGRTPYEVLQASGLIGIDKLLAFPTLILDDVIDHLRLCNKPIEFEQFAKNNPKKIHKASYCQKTKRDIETQFFLPLNAQNVLTYYP